MTHHTRTPYRITYVGTRAGDAEARHVSTEDSRGEALLATHNMAEGYATAHKAATGEAADYVTDSHHEGYVVTVRNARREALGFYYVREDAQ